jgi:hypothetical protein
LKLTLTAALAALIVAVPVSIDLARPQGATPNHAEAIGIGLKIDTAEARVGRPATPGSVAGVARRTTRRTVRRVTPYAAPVAVVRPVAGAAAVGAAAAATAGAAARCTIVVVDGVKVRRCGVVE